jgi:nicotinate-nucleotide pyrophosphorylase (carboxylating)
MIEYNQFTKIPEAYLKRKIDEFLAEDSPSGDYTTSGTVPPETQANAYIEAQAGFVFCGTDVIKAFFSEDIFSVEIPAKEGGKVTNGDILARITGPAGIILTRERIVLNLIQRMCGISTKTAGFAQIAKPHGVKVLDTRKTMPGLRLFDKYAVTAGGGHNHRMDLSSGILIKDNHVKSAGSISNALKFIMEKNYGLPVELEVDNFEQIKESLDYLPDGFLLDNFTPEETRAAVSFIRSLDGGENVFIESSGGININTIGDYVTTGINAVSVGSLTHSVNAAEMHMEIE